jgi:acetate kinase
MLQVACFDTAFHRDLPDVAQRLPLPRQWHESGVRRYGFHGLSYEYIVDTLRDLDAASVDGRVIVAHLGSGASMAAIRAGRSLDTSMGYTPVSGLMMGTRTGDLDPAVLLHCMEQGMSAGAISALINQQSGLLGVSGSSADMRELLQRAPHDHRAQQAVDLFCYRARQYLGAYTAVLGGVDLIVFTGGMGERAPEVRSRICAGMDYLGITLNSERNAANAAIISGDTSRVVVRVMHTDENLMMARHAARLAMRPR